MNFVVVNLLLFTLAASLPTYKITRLNYKSFSFLKHDALLNDKDILLSSYQAGARDTFFSFASDLNIALEAFNFDFLKPLTDDVVSIIKVQTAEYGPKLWSAAEVLAAEPLTIPTVTLLVFLSVIGGFGQDDSKVGSPYDAGETSYDVNQADLFYGSRPLFVFRRLVRLAKLTTTFNLKLLLDWRFGNLEKNQPERAKEALTLATQLGPTFIKLGQALSIRTDLIPEAYALELRQLQDAVPPFDSAMAKEIVRKELGVNNLNERFQKISDVPVASASIGQVYRATLKDGRDVAVKVQRPNILGEIALDLYILRLLTPLQVTLSNAINKRKTDQSDIDVGISLVDEWGRGFVAEVDYRMEAKNTKQFMQAMADKGLDAVTAPSVVDELSGSRVICTEWMEGTRLDRDASPDVPRLCGVAINAYLTMLLDTGTLHCDPHPGNLLRTRDGKLCILDWGMTLTVPRDLQYSLLEFIAHINTEDYDALPADFINLGFSPPGKLDQLKRSGLTESLSFAFRQLTKGGGPAKIRDRVKEEFKARYGDGLSDEELRAKARDEMISRMQAQLQAEGVNVNGVTGVMEEMSRRNRELFKLPPYVLYVSRAFSTLEGIGLSVDPNYSIVQECYPYLARRLMTDSSPRSKNALRAMLYGASPVLSVDKFVEMSDGFSSYVAATASADRDGAGLRQAQSALAELILQEEGNHVQDLLLESAAKTTDALLREGYSLAKQSRAGQMVVSALKFQKSVVEATVPAPLRGLALPFILPYKLAMAVDTLVEKNSEDEKSINSVKAVQALAQRQFATPASPQISSQLAFPPSSFMSAASVTNTASVPATGADVNPLSAFGDRLQQELADPNSQIMAALRDEKFRNRLPGSVANLTRRFGSALLHRAAHRLETLHTVSATSVHATAIPSDEAAAITGLLQELLGDDDRQLTQRVSSLTASTAKSLAKALEPVQQ